MEGKPGTGKTHMAKAMARHAGVPFLFVSATSFQSMWYGMTARKIRAYFKALRKVARQEGGAVGFIEEIDAIGGRRGGFDGGGTARQRRHRRGRERAARPAPELRHPTAGGAHRRPAGALAQRLAAGRAAAPQAPLRYNNILVIAASNRAGALDPALLRPGRFDRRLHFDLPNAAARRELVDYLLARKAHHGELDDDLQARGAGAPDLRLHAGDDRAPARRGAIWALRDGRDGMRWADINQAKLSGEIGLKQPVACTPLEEMVATHEAGHAVAAHLSGVGRKLEVLSIVKRKKALGLLAHNGRERTERLPRDAKAAVREQLDRNRVLVEALRDALLEREELVGDEILEVPGRAEAGRATPPRRGPRRACSPAAPPPGSRPPSGVGSRRR